MSTFSERRAQQLEAEGTEEAEKLARRLREQSQEVPLSLAQGAVNTIRDTLKNSSSEKLPSKEIQVLQQVLGMTYRQCVLAATDASRSEIERKPSYFLALANRIDKGEDSAFAQCSLPEILASMKNSLKGFVFIVPRLEKSIETLSVLAMTVDERESALRAATEEDIKKDPVHYLALVEVSISHLDSLYRDTVKNIQSLKAVFDECWRSPFPALETDIRNVAHMNRDELQEALRGAIREDVQRRRSFYKALLERLEKEY